MYSCFKSYINEATSDFRKQLYNKLNEYDDNVYVHFSRFQEIKINPKPVHTDPIGIYAFPKSYIFSKINVNQLFATMPYAFILKAKSNHVLNLSTISMPEVYHILNSLNIPDIKNINSSPGEMLWKSMESFVRGDSSRTRNYEWNKLFNKLGIDTIIDEGNGIIHNNEPAQIIFLSSKAYEIIDSFNFNTSNTTKSVAYSTIEQIASKIFDGEYKPRYSTNGSYPSKKEIVFNGQINGKNYSLSFNYDNPDSDIHSHRIYGGIYLTSKTASEHASDKLTIDSDTISENEINRIVSSLKEKLGQMVHRDDKSQYASNLINIVLQEMKFGGSATSTNREEYVYKKQYPDKEIMVSTDFLQPNYSLNIKIIIGRKSYSRGITLYSHADMNSETVEKYPKIAARKLIQKCLSILEKDIYKHYNPDVDKHGDYASYKWEWARNGQQAIQWIKELREKALLH